MAATKLTLLVEKRVIERAKRYTKRHRTTISRLVSHLLENLPNDGEGKLPASIQRLVGVLPESASRTEHREHLRKKYKL